jgi:hypothetical protein
MGSEPGARSWEQSAEDGIANFGLRIAERKLGKAERTVYTSWLV